jgi:hypothetical protein
MMTFNLNNKDEVRDFAEILAQFQFRGVEYGLSYNNGTVTVRPFGAHFNGGNQ